MVVQRRYSPRRLCDDDDDDELVSLLRKLRCHIESHSVTCHPAEVTFPPIRQ